MSSRLTETTMTTKECFAHQFHSYKSLAEQAFEQVSDEQFFVRPSPTMNSIALIVKHLTGNLRSRWSDFLESDGEKPWRERDAEFEIAVDDTRDQLLKRWEESFRVVFESVEALTLSDLENGSVRIRGEELSVVAALARSVTHLAYHVGQIVYLSRLVRGDEGWRWLTIQPKGSEEFNASLGYDFEKKVSQT
ncbi:MAG: DUF1572 family protein [Bdellovibrionales bacterium]|nr:DUF1572 family protein [Bdellovibrionales bacterium]